ncbi:MAG: hypothetical protein R3B84_06505 [Zavarzinella sp.]
MKQTRAIGTQNIAFNGLVDSAGAITGTPGTFVGSGTLALASNHLGRTSYQPGYRLELGYRTPEGMRYSVSWLHLNNHRYSGGASFAPANPFVGANLADTFLFSPVFNFGPNFAGAPNRITIGGAAAPGAINGIWNGATNMTIDFNQQFDNWDVTARVPIVGMDTELARTYAMAGGRFSWFFERFNWRTESFNIDTAGNLTGSGAFNARYTNTLSQRMYGVFLGSGHEIYLPGGVAANLELTAAPLVAIVKEKAKYVRGDDFNQAKRTNFDSKLVLNGTAALNFTWYPSFMPGMMMRAGYTGNLFMNTVYMDEPVGFNFGSIDPAYSKKLFRIIHGCNFGIGYVW